MDAQQMQEERSRELLAQRLPNLATRAEARAVLALPDEKSVPTLGKASTKVLEDFAEEARAKQARQDKLRDAMAQHLRHPTSR